MRILLVDDAHAVRSRLAEMLGEVPGVSVVVQAATTREALSALATESLPLDVVLLDLHLGGESGLALVPAARSARPKALVVVLTNDPSEHHRRECFGRGANFFFDKSRDFDKLVELVTAAAARQG